MDDDCKSHSAGRFRIESGDLEGSEEVRILLYSHKIIMMHTFFKSNVCSHHVIMRTFGGRGGVNMET